jgi:hypothetical protein
MVSQKNQAVDTWILLQLSQVWAMLGVMSVFAPTPKTPTYKDERASRKKTKQIFPGFKIW